MSEAPAPRVGVTRAVLVAALVALGLLLPPAATPHAAAGSCDGVTVRVERPGRTTDRCAPGDPRDGLAALESAGHRYVFVPGQHGMVCTIDGHPDPCNDAPADAYWSYWHADEGATRWTYATRGAGSRDPAPGSHEAWVFGAGEPPSAPPPAPAPEPSPSPTRTPAPSDDGASGGSGDGSGGGSSSGGSGGSGSSGGTESSGGASAAPRSTSDTEQGQDRSGPADDPGTHEGIDEDPARDADSDGTTTGDEDDTPDDAQTPDEDTGPDDAADEDEPADDDADDEVRPEALDDTVTVDAPEGGRGSGTAATVAALLVVGIGAAGAHRARARRDDLEPDA